jgi:hypothetical protein
MEVNIGDSSSKPSDSRTNTEGSVDWMGKSEIVNEIKWKNN